MGIKSRTPIEQVKARLDKHVLQADTAARVVLSRAGEIATNAARASDGYIDRTHNLRSSTGYVVKVKGAASGDGSFSAIGQGTAGADKGRDYASDLAARATSRYYLVCVAGMNYASHLQNRGRDVLRSAKTAAETEINRKRK